MKVTGLTKIHQKQLREFCRIYRGVHGLNLKLSGDRHERMKMHKMIRWYIQDQARAWKRLNAFMEKCHVEV